MFCSDRTIHRNREIMVAARIQTLLPNGIVEVGNLCTSSYGKPLGLNRNNVFRTFNVSVFHGFLPKIST